MKSPDDVPILKEYDEAKELYSAFADEVKRLVEGMLKAQTIKVHSVTSRLKCRGSLAQKIQRFDARYGTLSDVTDVAGVRIITYLSDQVDKIAGLIEREFFIDKENSVDKRQMSDPDRFGYSSLHQVVSLSEHRAALVEYKRFHVLKAEIQIRSILQHAWAEIEHDLQYKTALAVPTQIRRKFSRLAALLELADEEFLTIRKYIDTYEKNVPAIISNTPDEISIDQTSLPSFIQAYPLLTDLTKAIAAITGGRLALPTPQLIGEHVQELASLEIRTIGDLQKNLEKNEKAVLSFARIWLKGSTISEFPKSISVHYLTLLLLAQRFSSPQIFEFLVNHGIGRPDQRKQIADRIVQTYEVVSRTNPI
jgi:ppGpp synthetase/RelA/SpoT-type nucleotidyltranferase